MRSKPLILIVDDEETFQEILGMQLASAGYDVGRARTAPEAKEQALKLQPDLILMDIHMGGGETGTDIALDLKQNAKTATLPIVFLTNLKEPWPGVAGESRKVAQEIGMQDFLQKTDDPKVIVEKVKTILAGFTISSPSSAQGN